MSNTAHCPSCRRLVFLPSGAIGAGVTCRGCGRPLRIGRTQAGSLHLFDAESPLPDGVRLKPAEGKWKTRFRRTWFWLVVAGALYFLFGSGEGTVAGYRAWSAKQEIAEADDEDQVILTGGAVVTAGEYRAQLNLEVALAYAVGYALSGIMMGLAFYSRRRPMTAILIALGISAPMLVFNAWLVATADPRLVVFPGGAVLLLGSLLMGLAAAISERSERIGPGP